MIDDLLIARENRILEIQANLSPVYVTILIKANIPGPDKNLNEAHLLVRLFCDLILKMYQSNQYKMQESADGPYAIVNINSLNVASTKLKMIELEETHELGRFIDLDVFGISSVSISRKELHIKPRQCYLCELDAVYCSRNQTHRLESLISYVKDKVFTYISKHISNLIQVAILSELNLEYKFGLVTPSSKGSHQDMDYTIMIKAQKVILPYLTQLFEIGYQASELSHLLEETRIIGIQAEQKMLKATHGVNAYKGLIFVLGLSLLSCGYALSNNKPFHTIFEGIQNMTKNIEDEFKNSPETSGLKAFHDYGFKGIRGEVKDGLPSVQSALTLIQKDNPYNLHHLLQHLIVVSEDTVFLKRALSKERYMKFKEEIKDLDVTNINELQIFNEKAIKENLSFGGSADLLITSLFLKSIEYLYT